MGIRRALLVEPNHLASFPSLGLLKLATYLRDQDYKIEYTRGCIFPEIDPDEIYITSLYTFDWPLVYKAIRHYRIYYKSKIILGGIYASLFPEHAKGLGADEVHIGLFDKAELLVPAWDLVPYFDRSLIFLSRGCVRSCPFCVVPKLEGKLRRVIKDIRPYVCHSKITFLDNNILALEDWDEVYEEILSLGKVVDFNQGLDAHYIDDKVAFQLSNLKMKSIRMACDQEGDLKFIKEAVRKLEDKVRRKDIFVYTLYNFEDTPDDFKNRIGELLGLGVVVYPMRYEPVALERKGKFIGKKWTDEELKMVPKALRILGNGGSFLPYDKLINKINKAKNFTLAFEVIPLKKEEMEIATRTIDF